MIVDITSWIPNFALIKPAIAPYKAPAIIARIMATIGRIIGGRFSL